MILHYILFLCALSLVKCAPAIGGRREFVEPKFLVARHPFTGQLYYTDLTKIKQPSPVRRLRIMMTGKTHVAGSHSILTAFHFRVRWVPPENWFDNFDESNRRYNLVCIAENSKTMHVQEFLNFKIDGAFTTGYEENFLIKDALDLMIRCRIRALNSANLQSKWLASERLFFYSRWMESK